MQTPRKKKWSKAKGGVSQVFKQEHRAHVAFCVKLFVLLIAVFSGNLPTPSSSWRANPPPPLVALEERMCGTHAEEISEQPLELFCGTHSEEMALRPLEPLSPTSC